MAQENISAQLNDLLASRDFQAELLDKEGRPTDAENAEIFTFDFVSSGGKNYGTMVIILDTDNEMQVFYGDNLGRSMEGDDKTEFFDFVQHLHKFANMRRWTYSPKNINQVKYTMQGLAAIREGLFEGYYGTRRVSYSGEPTEARLVIQHNRVLGETDARFRYVESLFIETADSERFRLQFKNLAGGRAMLEHVRQGGRPYDVRGSHITEMVSEIATLSRFNRASAGRVLEGVTAELVTEAQHYYKSLRENLKRMAGTRGYQAYFESWHPADTTLQEELVENIKTMFVEQTLDSRIEAALPVLARLQQENRMKEADIFESWADNLTEGTWQLPETPEQQQKLQELMSGELIVGPDATNATSQLDDLVGDDVLFDRLGELAARDASANVWDDSEVQARLAELGIQLPTAAEPAADNNNDGDDNNNDPAAQQPMNEGRVKELEMDIVDPLMSDEEFETKYEDSRENMAREMGLTQDRKTGRWYNPDQEFDRLRNSPEFGAQMKRMSEGYPKHQDLSGISTDKLKAYLDKQSKQQNPGEGNQVKRVRAELQRRQQGVTEGDVFRRHGKNRNPTIPELEMWIKNWTSFQIGGNLTDAGRAKVGQSIAKAQRLLAKKKQQQGVAEGSLDDIEDTKQFRDAVALAKTQKAIRQAKYGKDTKFYADGTPVTPEEIARRAAERKARQQGVAEGLLGEFAMGGDDGEDPTDNYPCYDCGSTIFLHHTKLCDLAEDNAIRDLPAKPGSQYWTGQIPKGLRPIPGLEQGVAEGPSTAMAHAAKRLTDPRDGATAKLRAAGDRRREDDLKSRNIAKKNEGVAEVSLNELAEPTRNYYTLSNGKMVQVIYRPNVNQSPIPLTGVKVSYVNPALQPQGGSFDSTGQAQRWDSAPDGVKQAIEKFVKQPGMTETALRDKADQAKEARSRDLAESLLAEFAQGLDGDELAEDAVDDFVAQGGKIQQGKTHRPRKSEKTDYGSRHIGTLGGGGKPSKVSGTAANTRVGAKPVVAVEASGCNHTQQGEMCAEHGLAECGMHESQIRESQQHLADLARLKSLALGR